VITVSGSTTATKYILRSNKYIGTDINKHTRYADKYNRHLMEHNNKIEGVYKITELQRLRYFFPLIRVGIIKLLQIQRFINETNVL